MADAFTYEVFLSHSAKDKEIVRPIAKRLREDGLRVWFDEWEIRPGDNIPAKIEEGLERSRVLVLCMSANAFGSEWAQLEAGTFRFRDPLNKERRFIPLRIDETPIRGSLAQFLYINWLLEDREEDYAKLLEATRPPANPATRQRQTAREVSVSTGKGGLTRRRNREFTKGSDPTAAVMSDADDNEISAGPVNTIYPYVCESVKLQDDDLIAEYAKATADELLAACNQMILCLSGFDTVFLLSPESTAEQARQIDDKWLRGFHHTHEMLCLAAASRKLDVEPYKELASSTYAFWTGTGDSKDTEAHLKVSFSPGIGALYHLKRALMIEIADVEAT